MTQAKRTCVLVLGMHRSGTSALARVLNLLGCELPKTLMGPGVGNDAGHWESRALSDFNDRLLESVGSSWDDWMAVNPGWLSSPKAAQCRKEASALLEQEFGSSGLFVLKDPRICRFAPFWLNVLGGMGIETRIVLPIRDPLEVAQSLMEREGCEPGIGHLLWLRYVLEAEVATRGHTRFFTSYDRLMEDWCSVAERAAEALELSWPRTSTEAESEVASFLDRKHRHHREIAENTLANLHLPVWIRDAFGILVDWAASGEKPRDHTSLDRIRTEFDAAALAFIGPMMSGRAAMRKNASLRDKLNVVTQKVVERDAEVTHLTVVRDALLKAANQAPHSHEMTRSEELNQLVRLGQKFKWAQGDERHHLETNGVNLVRTDFYSDTPSLAEIESSFEYAGSEGVHDSQPVFDDPRVFDLASVVEFANGLVPHTEGFAPPVEQVQSGFYWKNSQFSGTDAMLLYGLILRNRPRTVVEIGSGFSTHVIHQALTKIGSGRLVCVDPEPRTEVAGLEGIEVINKPLQSVGTDVFSNLLPGDIVFYDGSHTVKTGSDTVYFYLKVLPYLPSGVLVHAHDVRLPYPRNKKALTEAKLYWGEPYLLMAHLFNTKRYKVLVGSELLQRRAPNMAKILLRDRFSTGGVSLWYKVL